MAATEVLELGELLADLADGSMELVLHLGVGRPVGQVPDGDHRLPQPVEESVRPLDSLVLPIAALLEGTHEHEVEPEGVGPVLLDDVVREGFPDSCLEPRRVMSTWARKRVKG